MPERVSGVLAASEEAKHYWRFQGVLSATCNHPPPSWMLRTRKGHMRLSCLYKSLNSAMYGWKASQLGPLLTSEPLISPFAPVRLPRIQLNNRHITFDLSSLSISIMSPIKDKLSNLNSSILKILEGSKAELTTVLIGFQEEKVHATYHTSDAGKAEIIESSHDRVFRIASLGKVYIAAAACLMIDVLSADPAPTNVYHMLKDTWDRSFTVLFNKYSKDSKISSLHGDPKLANLLLHYKGVRNTNHLLFSPDGTLLQSEEDFLKTVSQYTEDTKEHDKIVAAWSEYSNANYILIALFLEAFLKSTLNKSLSDFLKENIFKPLEMHHTYLSSEDLLLLPDEQRARPHVVYSTRERRQVIESNDTNSQFDAIEFATLGPYSSIHDQGRFFGSVNSALDGKSTGNIGVEFANSFFRSKSSIISGQVTSYTRCGLYTTSDTTYPGSNSFNRLIFPNSKASKHTMGKMRDGSPIKLYYMQGSATGWGCTVYFAAAYRVFVIVLTNTSGPVDVSDPISQLCFQEIFDLLPSIIGNNDHECHSKGLKNKSLADRRAYYVELNNTMFEENALKLGSFEHEDAADDIDVAGWEGVCGTYSNTRYRQYLYIEGSQGKLRVRMKSESKSKWSNSMRFVHKGDDVYRICSINPLEDHMYRGLAIDCFGAWKNLEFQAERVGGEVRCLSRTGLEIKDNFLRQG